MISSCNGRNESKPKYCFSVASKFGAADGMTTYLAKRRDQFNIQANLPGTPPRLNSRGRLNRRGFRRRQTGRTLMQRALAFEQRRVRVIKPAVERVRREVAQVL